MLAGSVGMVVSSFAATSVDYDPFVYNFAYRKSGEFKYRNAAVKGLSDALDEQLRGWREWKYVPYAINQARGDVQKVKSTMWSDDDLTEYKNYKSNIFDTMVAVINNNDAGLGNCRGIASTGNVFEQF